MGPCIPVEYIDTIVAMTAELAGLVGLQSLLVMVDVYHGRTQAMAKAMEDLVEVLAESVKVMASRMSAGVPKWIYECDTVLRWRQHGLDRVSSIVMELGEPRDGSILTD